MSDQPIYLDNNATTRPSPGAVDAVGRALEEFWHNPSSVHRPGQAARAQVELARASIAELIGAKAREVAFTSSGTEALDLAIRGLLDARAPRRSPANPAIILTTPVEHSAVRELCESLATQGAVQIRLLDLERTPLKRGMIDVSRLRERITPDAALVCVQWANNETGVVQPVREVCAAARSAGVPSIIDAVQWVGKCPTDVARDASGQHSHWCDALALSAHKFHGPKGVGALWTRPGLRIVPRLLGTQELGRRGGTENVPGILGAGVAAREAMEWLRDSASLARMTALRDRFEQRMTDALPESIVLSPADPALRLWNTTNIAFPGLEAEAILLMLSERGVCASAGASCSSGSLEPSPVLLAMGVEPRVAHGAIRFSLSRETTRHDVDHAADVVVECVRQLAS